MNLSHTSRKELRTLVRMGMIAPELAHKVARERAARYAASPKYADKPQKIQAWVDLAKSFAQADAPKPAKSAKPKAKVKAKAAEQPKAEFAAKPKVRLTKASARDLIASRRILSNDEKAALAAFLERI